MSLKSMYSICPIFVLSLGMISCSSEKKVAYQADSFQPENITISNLDKSEVRLSNFSKLDLGSTISVGSFQNNDFTKNPVFIKVVSQCQQDGVAGQSFQETLFQNTSNIEALKIIPNLLLESVSAASARCHFTFVFTNSISSSKTIVKNDIVISNLATYANLKNDLLTSPEINYNDLKDEQLTANETGNMRLSCQDLSINFPQLSDSFFISDLQLENPSTQQSLTRSKQMCRFVFRGKTQIQVSSVFALYFPVSPIEIKTTVVRFGSEGKMQKPKVVEITLRNPNPYSLPVKIKNANEGLFKFRPIYGSRQMHLGAQHELALKLIPQSVEFQQVKKDLFFSLPALSQMQIDGHAQIQANCWPGKDKADITTPDSKKTKYFGANYGFRWSSQIIINDGSKQHEPLEIDPRGALEYDSVTDLPYWLLPSVEDYLHLVGLPGGTVNSTEQMIDQMIDSPMSNPCK